MNKVLLFPSLPPPPPVVCVGGVLCFPSWTESGALRSFASKTVTARSSRWPFAARGGKSGRWAVYCSGEGGLLFLAQRTNEPHHGSNTCDFSVFFFLLAVLCLWLVDWGC